MKAHPTTTTIAPMRACCALPLLLTCFPHLAHSQSVIRVPADQPSIQAAIDAASDGSTVSIAPGTYFENIDFRGKAITVAGDGPRATVILDGSLRGPVVSFQTGEGRGSTLRHLTVQHGAPATLTYQGQLTAGGIFINAASPTITDVAVLNNTDCGIGAYASALLLQGSLVDGTTTGRSTGCPVPEQEIAITLSAQGTGIFLVGQPASGTQAAFQGNTISNNAGTASASAGFQALDAGSLLIENNLVTANRSEALGAGIGVLGATSAALNQNVVANNIEDSPATIHPARAEAGGINIDVTPGARVTLTNNTVAGNRSIGQFSIGTQVYTHPLSAVFLANNLIVAADGLTALECDLPAPGQAPGTLTLDHNDAFSTGTPYGDRCAGSLTMDGNIAADPLFSGPSDYTLPANSPAVDAGDNGAVGVGTLDFNGAPRIQNAKGLATAIIDMGAFERAGVPAALPAPDFTLSADTTAVDLTTTRTATVMLTLGPNSSFTSAVALACAGLPANVQCTFQPTSVSLGKAASQTVQLVLTVPGTQASSDPEAGMLLAILLLPYAGRRRATRAAALISLLGLAGCINVTPRTTAVSAVTVTAAARSGQQHTVSLNVKAPI